MKDLYQYLKEQMSNMSLIYNVSRYQTKSTQLGKFLGAAWQYLDPIVQLCIYYFVFIIMFKRKISGGIPPAPWMFVGLGNWFFYSISIQSGAASVQSQLSLFTQVKFPISVLPTIEMFKRFNILIWMTLLGILLAIKHGYYPSFEYLQLFYYFLALCLLVMALSLLFSTIVVVFRDFLHIINYIFRFLLYVSGAALDLTLMEALPLPLRQGLRLDPFIYVMEGFRDAIFNRGWFWEKPGYALVFWCFTLGVLIVAAHLHMKLRNQFMDYV